MRLNGLKKEKAKRFLINLFHRKYCYHYSFKEIGTSPPGWILKQCLKCGFIFEDQPREGKIYI